MLSRTLRVVSSAEFHRLFPWYVLPALILAPTSGVIVMSFLGIYPWPEIVLILFEFGALVIVAAIYLLFRFSRAFTRRLVDVVEKGTGEEKTRFFSSVKRLLPIVYFGSLTLYTAIGISSANLSLSMFHGFDYSGAKFFYTFIGIIPVLLITTFPIYFLLTDFMGRYLAPRNIQVLVAPLSVKITILGIFTPLLIDTVLLVYYYDRTGYLSLETISLWMVLLLIAGAGAFMAWRSLKQGMYPFYRYLYDLSRSGKETAARPELQALSLDELGVMTARYAEIIKYNVEMEHDLSKERRFVNTVLENANALIVVLDKQGRVRRFNHACEKISGYTYDEMRNGYIWDYLLDPREAEVVREQAFDALANNPQKLVGSFTNYWVSRTGRRYLIEWSNSLLLDSNGEMQYMVCIGVDVTEKHKSRQQLIESNRLQDSLLAFSRQLESAKSCDEVVGGLSEEVERNLGVSTCWICVKENKDDLGCRMVAWSRGLKDISPEDHGAPLVESLVKPFLGGMTDSSELMYVPNMSLDPRSDKALVRQSGIRSLINIPLFLESRWVGVIGIGTFGDSVMAEPNERQKSWLLSLATHVTSTIERIKITMALEESNEQLESRVEERTKELRDAQDELLRKERLAALGQLTATVSHELRNPLTSMRPSTYLLRKKLQGDESLLAVIDRIERSIDRCDRIVEDLLDFARTARLSKSRQEFDSWIQGVVQEQMVPENCKIDLHLGLNGYEADFDAHRLRRALINVLDNAVQSFSANKSDIRLAEPHIELATRRVNGRIELSMHDNGPGIPDEVLPHIFEPLYSTKSFGVGLGMPTVKQIMEQHQGGIEVKSSPGRGTTVTLWLPA